MRHGVCLAASFAFTLAALVRAGDASACGGCFPPQPPPGESISLVTDHRMILSVSQKQTTLYDQIQYSGSPESFAWVLPISGTVEVGLSSDVVFNTLSTLTQTTIVAPPTNCPAPPACEYDDESPLPSAGSATADAGANGVEVLKQETVGPYETVQLRSTNGDALSAWLTQNGFQIGADIKPVIGAYVTEHFDFLALKLKPGAGIKSMRPVRVTAQGASPTLPLRMVAAGTGATVGISLWVLGEGRYEPQNFPAFAIPASDLVWTWATSSSNYKELRAQRATAAGGKGWEIENSIGLNRNLFTQYIQNANRFGDNTVPTYLPVEENGAIVKTADQVRDDDLAHLFGSIAQGQERVTRMRADLAKTALTTDLAIQASGDQAILSNVRQATKEVGEPLCPVYQGCSYVGQKPRTQAIQENAANNANGTFACRTAPENRASSTGHLAAFGGLGAMLALAVAKRRRRG